MTTYDPLTQDDRCDVERLREWIAMDGAGRGGFSACLLAIIDRLVDLAKNSTPNGEMTNIIIRAQDEARAKCLAERGAT